MVIYRKLLPRTKKKDVFYLSLKISSLNRLASYDEYPPGVHCGHRVVKNINMRLHQPYKTMPSTIVKHITYKDFHAYLLSNPRLLGKVQYTEKYGLKSVVAIYLQILFHFSQ